MQSGNNPGKLRSDFMRSYSTYDIRFIPPHLDRDRSNIENSENTTLFLVSCYEYILSAIVLSIGPPFRQSMAHNCELIKW